jgi:hypothetical protein
VLYGCFWMYLKVYLPTTSAYDNKQSVNGRPAYTGPVERLERCSR